MAPLRPQILHSYRPCLCLRDTRSRYFTTAPVLQKQPALPSFQPTSSPDLDALLSTIRSNIFIPKFLPEPQQRAIYRGNKHHLLTGDDPVMANIGKEVVQMRPIDRMRDEPPLRQSVSKILDLMAEAGGDAWENLPGLLMGLRRSRWQMKAWQQVKVVRRACFAKKEGLIMQCMKQVDLTGLSLREAGAAMEMVRAALRRAQEKGWSREGLQHGIKFAESVWWLMQEPKHIREGKNDPMRNPGLVGILVLLHAAKAVRFDDYKDPEGNIARYVEILLARFKNGGPDGSVVGVHSDDANQKLVDWVPVWHGMKMARQVLGERSELGQELGTRLLQEVEPMLRRAREETLKQMSQERTLRGLKMEEELSSLSP